jgi:endonuclease YncB( thermonuclease family)
MLTALLIILTATPPPSAPIYGLARAGDGDSLIVGDARVRLFGIDGPEFDQVCTRGGVPWSCGAEAADRLSRLVTGRHVQCDPLGEDQHGRALGRCFVGTTEVNRVMVEAGYAVAFRRYSRDYVAAENAARAAKRGLWAGSFEMPAEFRASARSGSLSPQGSRDRRKISRPRTASVHACNIKGNHSRRGVWIYHLPGMPYYDRTRPEALFCSEAEAQAAGYRRAIVR